MNPCPCGNLGHPKLQCRCSPDQIARYKGRLSGPLLDRIDLHIEVPALPEGVLSAERDQSVETSAQVREKVTKIRNRQLARSGVANAALAGKVLEDVCRLKQSDSQFLESAMQKLGLSARAYHRILRVARTIADLVGSETIEMPHLTEALSYRRLDRKV